MKTEPKFTLTKFKSEHAYRVLEYLIESKYAIIPRERWDKSIRLWDTGKAFTLMADNIIVGCGGVMIREPGLGEKPFSCLGGSNERYDRWYGECPRQIQ